MKVMWLYDIFNDDSSAIPRMLTALKSLGFTPNDTIHVTYVSHPGENETALSADASLAQAKKFLGKQLTERKTAELNLKGTAYYEDSNSFRKIADRALAEAKKSNMGLIALQTHGKKGFKEYLLGSFAETIIHRSRLSMLILSPVCKPTKKVKKILYATDLASGSLDGVVQAATIAKKANATLCLFHIPQPIYNNTLEDLESEAEKYRKTVQRKMNLLVVAAEKLGVTTNALVDSSWKSASDLILKAAVNQQADLVALHAKTGSVGNIFLGSTTSSLIRAAHIPVYVLRL